MERVLERARMAAGTDASVLCWAKPAPARRCWRAPSMPPAARARMPFVAVNSGALPRELVESELFGFRKGAFTGAYADAPGIFTAATGGTVFLDELGEMPKDVQVKLLRVLQEKELRPVGGTRAVPVDVRIVAATNRTLGRTARHPACAKISTSGLPPSCVDVPPLRSRPEDILVLSQHFAARLSRRYGREITLGRPALELLLAYAFPGNVRELENLMESVAAVSADNPQTITDKDLKPMLGGRRAGLRRCTPTSATRSPWNRWSASPSSRRCAFPPAIAPRPPRCSASRATRSIASSGNIRSSSVRKSDTVTFCDAAGKPFLAKTQDRNSWTTPRFVGVRVHVDPHGRDQ